MAMKFFLILLISFSSVYLVSNESNIASKINQVLPEGMSVQSVRRSQIDNLYIVDIGDLQPIYASENGDFFLYGELFGIKNKLKKGFSNNKLGYLITACLITILSFFKSNATQSFNNHKFIFRTNNLIF